MRERNINRDNELKLSFIRGKRECKQLRNSRFRAGSRGRFYSYDLVLARHSPSTSVLPRSVSSRCFFLWNTTGFRGVHPLFEKKLNQFVKRKKLSPLGHRVPSLFLPHRPELSWEQAARSALASGPGTPHRPMRNSPSSTSDKSIPNHDTQTNCKQQHSSVFNYFNNFWIVYAREFATNR